MGDPAQRQGRSNGVYVVDIHNPKAREAGLGQLRLVRYFDIEQKRKFEFLTNNFV
jgi:hypothetical protein